jgi:type III secretion system YscJ/HrcJ family lipoprotein
LVWAILLAGLATGLAGCDGEEVATTSSEREANEILVALDDAEVSSASVSRDTQGRQTVWRVRVSKTNATSARRALLALDLPRPPREEFGKLVGDSGFLPSQTTERARLMRAIASELERTFESIDGIVLARVHVVLPERDPLAVENTPAAPPTAAVLLKYDASKCDYQDASGLVLRSTPAKADTGSTSAAGSVPPVSGSTVNADPVRLLDQIQVRSLVENAIEGLGASRAGDAEQKSSGAAISIAFTPSGKASRAPGKDASSGNKPGLLPPQGLAVITIVSAALATAMTVLWMRERRRA